jgi:predicted phage terminase large subunit-like protein
VVGIDPAVSMGEDSNATGLVVAGLGEDGHVYILEDGRARLAPYDWARRAIGLYRRWGADRIVAESNQGGALVEATIRAIDQNVSFTAVHASRGKITRAEPIAALFEQNRAHIVGCLPELEDEMATFAAGSSTSPDSSMRWSGLQPRWSQSSARLFASVERP